MSEEAKKPVFEMVGDTTNNQAPEVEEFNPSPSAEAPQETQEDNDSDDGGQETVEDSTPQQTETENETPSGESDTDTVLLNADVEDSTPEQETQEQPSFSLDSEIDKASGGKFKSYSEIEEAMNQTPESTFADERVKKINDYVAKGGKLEDFLQSQFVDYTEMDEMQLVKNGYKAEYPDLTSEEINDLINEDFKLLDDEFTEREIKAGKAKMKAYASRKKAELIAKQKELALPPAPEQTQKADQSKAIEAQKQKWSEVVESSLKDFESVDIVTDGKGTKFQWKIDQKSKENLKTSMKNVDQFFNRYIDESGKQDLNKLAKDLFFLDNKDSIIKALVKKHESAGQDKVLDALTNPSEGPVSKNSDPNRPKSIQEQVAEQFMKAT